MQLSTSIRQAIDHLGQEREDKGSTWEILLCLNLQSRAAHHPRPTNTTFAYFIFDFLIALGLTQPSPCSSLLSA